MKFFLLKRILLVVFVLWPVFSLAANDYTFDLSEIEKKPYSIGGFLEIRPVLSGLNRDSAFYRLKYFNQDPESVLDEYNMGLRLEGSYEKGKAGVHFRTDTVLRYDDQGWSDDIGVLEGYLSLKPTTGFSLNAGKRVVPWGKGYAFNPVAFVSRPKDPNDPTEALEGFYMIDVDFIKSYEGPLKTLAFTPVFLPVTNDINDDFGEADHINFAAKLYLLLWDTDLDFMVFTGDSRTTRYGLDFSRNILTNFEIHGEAAWVNDFQKKSIDSQGKLTMETADVLQALLGIRYLTANDITYIIEYYHNGGGIEVDDAENFYKFIESAYNRYLANGDSSQLARASMLSRGTLASAKPMRDYLYFRASIKEPFDILYLTPAITLIVNLNDQSISLTPELAYTPITNLELRLRSAFLIGAQRTEFGEKQNDWRTELRVRYFF
ncbi:MAG: hypothetical protein HQ552_12890 [Desulfobacteraceae bacterium]|nr:hypothetical protein [Desulfobacteraceae bacterium]